MGWLAEWLGVGVVVWAAVYGHQAWVDRGALRSFTPVEHAAMFVLFALLWPLGAAVVLLLLAFRVGA